MRWLWKTLQVTIQCGLYWNTTPASDLESKLILKDECFQEHCNICRFRGTKKRLSLSCGLLWAHRRQAVWYHIHVNGSYPAYFGRNATLGESSIYGARDTVLPISLWRYQSASYPHRLCYHRLCAPNLTAPTTFWERRFFVYDIWVIQCDKLRHRTGPTRSAIAWIGSLWSPSWLWPIFQPTQSNISLPLTNVRTQPFNLRPEASSICIYRTGNSVRKPSWNNQVVGEHFSCKLARVTPRCASGRRTTAGKRTNSILSNGTLQRLNLRLCCLGSGGLQKSLRVKFCPNCKKFYHRDDAAAQNTATIAYSTVTSKMCPIALFYLQ